MDPTSDSAPDPELAIRADQAAASDHDAEDATARHQEIASALWAALRRLGVAGGRMLVMGEDPEVYAGLPAEERRIPYGMTAELTGRIPTTPWPHTGLQLRQHPDQAPDPYDLVIDNIPSNDMVLHTTDASTRHLKYQAFHTLGSIGLTRPGGITALLASSRLLDDPDPYVRLEMERSTELLGAVRLPAGALRRAPGNDGPVDLLLLRPSSSPVTTPFAESVPVTLDGRTVYVSQYYDTHPGRVLGNLTSRAIPWVPPTTTVVADPGDLSAQLRDALNDITSTARARGLTTTPSTADLDATVGHTLAEPGRHTPRVPTEIPARDLDKARAVIARLRAQRRSTRPPAADHDRPAPGAQPDQDIRGL